LIAPPTAYFAALVVTVTAEARPVLGVDPVDGSVVGGSVVGAVVGADVGVGGPAGLAAHAAPPARSRAASPNAIDHLMSSPSLTKR
jgi:hypothetical protein